MLYYPQNGYRSRENQCDKPETMGTGHPAWLRTDMISILNYREYYHGGICFILAAESVPCPICGGKLFVHGTCRRKCITADGIVTFGLRVMECRKCHHTHRELPRGIVPYKRHCAEIIADCRDTCPDSVGEFSVFLRLKAWMTWFLDYAEKVMTGLTAAYDTVLSVPGNLTPAERLVYFVRLVANSGFWVQHRSALRTRTDSGML